MIFRNLNILFYKYLLAILLLLAASFSYAQSVEIKRYYDPERKLIQESFFVKSQKSMILQGQYKSYYLNGNLKSKGSYKNNLPDGYWEYYYENNKVKNAGTLVDNVMQGHWKFYFENGNMNMEGKMVGGVRKGEWKFYFESGGLKMQGYLDNDEKIGLWKYYYEDGQLKAHAIFKNARGLYQEYYITGKLKSEGLIVNGKSDSIWKYYHENGKLQAIGHEKDGVKTGDWKFYYDNGTLSSEGSYENGETNGNWKYFYPSGRLSSEGAEKAGIKEGYWKLYYENAKIKGEGNFLNGDGEYKEYYESGKLKVAGYIKNGKNEGEWNYFYETGELEAKCFFKAGEGNYTGYYEGGKHKMEGTIKDNKKVGVWKLYDQDGKVAGYYKTFYDNNIPQFEKINEAPPPKDSVIVYQKPDIRIRKRRSRYFTPKHNEFKGFIVSSNPAAMIIGSIPLSVEYYIQERLGFEFIYTWDREPFFISGQNVGFNKLYERGYETAIRLKLYQPDQNIGMFYIANELRYSNTNHLANIIDSTSAGPIPTSIKAKESKIEYSFILGNRLMKYAYGSGFTLDFFAGLGIGYRIYREKFQDNPNYSGIFKDVNNKPVTFPVRVGFTLGYVF